MIIIEYAIKLCDCTRDDKYDATVSIKTFLGRLE